MIIESKYNIKKFEDLTTNPIILTLKFIEKC